LAVVIFYFECMDKHSLFPRLIHQQLRDALDDSPVVLIHGPRQCGKTTLARLTGEERGYTYYTFDDGVLAAAVAADPAGFIADLPELTLLDEVQRIPGLFNEIKRTVDADRRPGRFLLTGSSNVLLVPQLADSLAGRMDIIMLHPLSQCELHRRTPEFLPSLFAGTFSMHRYGRMGAALPDIMAAGGYPAALARPAASRRARWYRNYIETLVQRDVRELARISSLDVLPRLLAYAAAQTACLLNVSDLASPFHLSRPTIRDYLTLLERLFLVDQLPPWHNNNLSRLIKTPKLHVGDTGFACALLGLDSHALSRERAIFGHMLETFVYQELRRQAAWNEDPIRFYHYRDKEGIEVDIICVQGNAIAGIEVKASSTVTASDFRGLRALQRSEGERFASGVVVYDGDMCVTFGDRLYAVPLRALWEAG
jgi:uncharacterized protein